MKTYNFYIDDSGTRDPDRKPHASSFGGDWFALGGVIVASDDEERARELHQAFCESWNITYPLHSVKIRHRSENFAWIGQLDSGETSRFFAELDKLIQDCPVVAMACVIDRPGYNTRYFEKYGEGRWSLCKTSFPIVAERAAKFARLMDARIRLYIERSDKKSENLLRGYYDKLRAEGMPFAGGGNTKYAPLAAEEFKKRLYDLKFKFKSSPMVQLADLMLYPLCKSAYAPAYRPMAMLREQGKLIEAILPSDMHAVCGTKYSCFDPADPISASSK